MRVNRGATAVGTVVVVIARYLVVGVIVGRIATVIVVITIGVVVWIHRRHGVRVIRTKAWRRHRRTIAVVVEAEVTGTVVDADARSHRNHHPRLVAITVPAETHWLEVLESGEAVKLITQFVVGHHRVGPRRIRTVCRDANGDPLDPTWTNLHPFTGIAVAVIGIEIDAHITSISIVSNILHIIVDRNRIGVIGQHGL